MSDLGMRVRRWTFAVLPWIVTMGCASREPDWGARRGHYTYEEAVQHYGEPASTETRPDGGKVGYWNLPEARAYAFRFQLPEFDGNSKANLKPGTEELPPGGQPLGTVGRPVLRLTFDSSDRLTDAMRLKEIPATLPQPEPQPAAPR
ncbi:MAG: hypothetical protein KIT22_08030 [Verrucomicrobiae bacterium]|nr:hypothetical protein [Verrucomicrobiae bacterium]